MVWLWETVMALEFVIVQNMVQSVIKCVYFLEENRDKVNSVTLQIWN